MLKMERLFLSSQILIDRLENMTKTELRIWKGV